MSQIHPQTRIDGCSFTRCHLNIVDISLRRYSHFHPRRFDSAGAVAFRQIGRLVEDRLYKAGPNARPNVTPLSSLSGVALCVTEPFGKNAR